MSTIGPHKPDPSGPDSSATTLRSYRVSSRRYRGWWNVAMYALLCLIAGMYLLPFIWAATASLKPLGDVYVFPPKLWVSDPQWNNFPTALSRLPFFRFVMNTLVIILFAVPGQVFTASLVGYAFARLQWKGRDFWFIVLLATMMLPSQILLIPQYLLYKELGWVNTYKPLIVPEWLGGGAFFIFLFRQFFKGIPREMEEAARIDGASDWQIYWRIVLPNAKPVLATVGVMSTINVWKEFQRPLIYLSDFERYPISLGLAMYNSLQGSQINLLMAASIVALAPLVLIFFLAQRYFVNGLLLSGSKG